MGSDLESWPMAPCVYSIIYRDWGSRKDFVCACAPALQMATSTGKSLKPSATTDAEVLLSGCTDERARVVVR